MKNYLKLAKRSVAAIGVAALLSLFSSCLKENSNYTPPPVALVSVFDASTSLPALDVDFNNNKVNWNPVTYGTGLSYVQAYTGLRTFNFYAYGENGLLFSDTATLKVNYVYSIFLTGTTAKTDFVILNDNINQPAANSASVRFVDLSPDAPAVDLVLADTVRASAIAYKGASQFVSIPGGKVYNLQVKQAGTNTVLATLNNISLNTNYVYTIMLTGLASGTTSNNSQLAVNYVINANF
jgi:hypothetical protein